MDLMQYLQQFEDGFKKAETKEPGEFDKLPDGKYKVMIEKARLEENRYTLAPQVAWEFDITEGEHKGRKIFKYSQIDTQEKANWLKQDLRNCGVIIESLANLPQDLPLLLDKNILVNLHSKKANNGNVYQNTYIVKEIMPPKFEDSQFPF